MVRARWIAVDRKMAICISMSTLSISILCTSFLYSLLDQRQGEGYHLDGEEEECEEADQHSDDKSLWIEEGVFDW